MKLTRFVQTGTLLSTLMIVVVGCGSSSPSNTGSGGTTATGSGGTTASTGGTTGSGGATGSGGTTGSGGATGSGGTTAPTFTAVAPCATASAYTTTGSLITFGGDTLAYSPKCLKVAAGTSVTFMGNSGQMFSDHPLTPSTARGTTTGNPIPSLMTSDNSTTVAFPTPGFYAYFCAYHGVDSGGTGMAGVVWVE